MKNKKIFALLFTMMLVFGALLLPINAAGTLTMTVSNASATIGSEVTLTISVENNPGIAGISGLISYDKSNLKLIKMEGNTGFGGMMTCDATKSDGFSLFSPSNITSQTLLMTLVFKINENAKPGNYSIGISASASNQSLEDVNVSVVEGTITVSCDHKYGGWEKDTDTQHKHTCTICGNVEKVAHTWNNGTITKAPTCREEGEKTYTCTACGATKTEKVSKTNNHKYGGWEVVKEATYSSKGERIRKCTVCGIIIAREDIPVKTSESTTTTTTTTTAATTTTITAATTTAATTTATTTTTTAATTTMTTAATTTATTTTTTATTTTTTPAATTTSSQSRGCKANIGVRASAVCVAFLGAVVIVLRKKREN